MLQAGSLCIALPNSALSWMSDTFCWKGATSYVYLAILKLKYIFKAVTGIRMGWTSDQQMGFAHFQLIN
jgi:hypothetical protein